MEPTCPSHASLKSGDILMAFDDVEIANDGTVPFRSGERIGFSYLVSNKYSGDTVRCCVRTVAVCALLFSLVRHNQL